MATTTYKNDQHESKEVGLTTPGRTEPGLCWRRGDHDPHARQLRVHERFRVGQVAEVSSDTHVRETPRWADGRWFLLQKIGHELETQAAATGDDIATDIADRADVCGPSSAREALVVLCVGGPRTPRLTGGCGHGPRQHERSQHDTRTGNLRYFASTSSSVTE